VDLLSGEYRRSIAMKQESMETTSHTVNLHYERHELPALFAVANAEDVEKGGRYDARSGARHIWSHHWVHPATREESEMMGSFSVNWLGERRQWQRKKTKKRGG
jgi:hypothetical protein